MPKQDSNRKIFALRARYKRSAGMSDTLWVLPEKVAIARHMIFHALSAYRRVTPVAIAAAFASPLTRRQQRGAGLRFNRRHRDQKKAPDFGL
jgi:hypothetical protein